MASTTKKSHFLWRGPGTFVVIAAGATLSLNDFLTFPVMAGENGGGAFLLLYTFFLAVLGLPLLMGELMMGRMSRGNIISAFGQLSEQDNASLYWKFIGFCALFAGFLILSSYSVVSGWSMAYFVKTGLGLYSGVNDEGVSTLFRTFQADAEAQTLWHTMFVLVIVAIGAQSLRNGLQKLFVVMVPMMAVLLIIGLVYAFYSGGMEQSIEYILHPDWSRVDSSMPLLALQRAFFTLALGLGVMLIYGSYLDSSVSIGYAALQIVLIDLLFSIFTGLAINALVFSVDLSPVLNDELAFRVLPVMFGAFEFGRFFGALFYLLLFLAAVTTAVAILEAILSCYAQKYSLSRLKAAIHLGLAVWLVGLGTIFSYSLWGNSGLTMTLALGDEVYRVVNEAGFHDVIIYLSSHVLQPLVALSLIIYVGWFIPRSASFEALNLPNRKLFELWNFVIRYITPVLVFIVLLSTLGILKP